MGRVITWTGRSAHLPVDVNGVLEELARGRAVARALKDRLLGLTPPTRWLGAEGGNGERLVVRYRGRHASHDLRGLFYGFDGATPDERWEHAHECVSPDFDVQDAPPAGWDTTTLHVPLFVSAEAPLAGSYHDHENRLPKDHRRALKAGERLGITCGVGDLRDLDAFYDAMLVPTSHEVHGPHASIPTLPQLEVRRSRLTLLWASRGEERLAGALVLASRVRSRAELWRVGLAEAPRRDKKLMRACYTALDASALAQAFQTGARTFSMGITVPCTADGLFLYKRRWGMRFVPSDPEGWLRVRACTRRAREALGRRPLLVWQGSPRAEPSLLTHAPTGDQGDDALRSLWHAAAFPGLRGALVYRGDEDAARLVPSALL